MPICLCPCPSITGLIPLPLTSCDHARGTIRWRRGEEPWNTRRLRHDVTTRLRHAVTTRLRHDVTTRRHDAVEEGRSRLTGFSLKLHLCP